MRQTAISFGLEFPTPALKPATPPVRPLVINPAVSALSRYLGYEPLPVRPSPPTPITFAPDPPPFSAAIYVYEGETFSGAEKSGWEPSDHFGATLGYRTKGHCGRPYHELGTRGGRYVLCPWTLDIDVDYNSSIFDSRFLGAEYQSYLDQIGLVPGPRCKGHHRAHLRR